MHLKSFIPLFFIISLATVGAGDFTRVKTAGIEGAIIPSENVEEWIRSTIEEKAESFWTPQAKDIELAESKLRAALEKNAKEFPKVEEILKHYSEYRRQYVGLVIKGRRHIYLNSFSPNDSFFNYTKKWVFVYDGGFWFWNILYSLEDGTFTKLSINGEA